MTVARYAVIGQPIAHSLSPRIHPLFAAQFGIALEYQPIGIAPEELTMRVPQLHADGYCGVNVTLPHKTAIAALCSSVSARADLAGAVNCLVRKDSGWHGDNTDGEGLMRDLARLQIEVTGRRVLLLGAGGAARGVLAPLLAAQPAELVLSGRNPWKPEQLVERFGKLGNLRPCTHLALKGDRYDLVINATSAGHAGEMPRLPGPLLAERAACYDLSYGGAHAPFAQWARQQNAAIVSDGLGMLVEQAAASFELWTGQHPQTASILIGLRS